jgi:hypothetical protein
VDLFRRGGFADQTDRRHLASVDLLTDRSVTW